MLESEISKYIMLINSSETNSRKHASKYYFDIQVLASVDANTFRILKNEKNTPYNIIKKAVNDNIEYLKGRETLFLSIWNYDSKTFEPNYKPIDTRFIYKRRNVFKKLNNLNK